MQNAQRQEWDDPSEEQHKDTEQTDAGAKIFEAVSVVVKSTT